MVPTRDDDEINEAITIATLTKANFSNAPTPILEEFIKRNPSTEGQKLLAMDLHQKIREFEQYCDSAIMLKNYALFEKANWDKDADMLWDAGIEKNEIDDYLDKIHKYSEQIHTSPRDADFKSRIKTAYRDELATAMRNEFLKVVASQLSGVQHSAGLGSIGPIQDADAIIQADIAALGDEIKALKRYAQPIEETMARIEKNDAEIRELLAQFGIKPKSQIAKTTGSESLLSALEKGQSSLKPTVQRKKVAEKKLDQLRDKLINELAELHIKISLLNTTPPEMLLSQISMQQEVIANLTDQLQQQLYTPKKPVSAAEVLERRQAIAQPTAKRSSMQGMLGEIQTGKSKLRSVTAEPKTPKSGRSTPSLSGLSESLADRRSQLGEDEEFELEEMDLDFPDSISEPSGRSSPKPTLNVEQEFANSLSEAARIRRLDSLHPKLKPADDAVSTQAINSRWANFLKKREEIMETHIANMQQAFSSQIQKRRTAEQPTHEHSSTPAPIGIKKTHLFTGGPSTTLEEAQVANHIDQVARDLQKAAEATEKMIDAIVKADPAKKDEMEVQREQLLQSKLGSKNPILQYKFDEDHDGTIMLEQTRTLVENATATYGVFENVAKDARATKSVIGGAFSAVKTATWNLIQLVINGLKKLVDMVTGLFKRKQYDESAFSPVQNAADMLAYRASNTKV